jgi:N-acylglucosamine 2-epimerase
MMSAVTLDLPGLRRRYREELFGSLIPFWENHGIDQEHGGFFHSLDYDGSLISTDKFHWFQGRGLWVLSFLHNHFTGDPRHLQWAFETREFLLGHFPQADGWWAEMVSREGDVLRPFGGDLYGMLFAAEGLQEYAFAARDDASLDLAVALLKKISRYTDRPEYGRRPQGLWMVQLRIATQILRRWSDPAVSEIADRCLDAILHRHYNPDLGLNNEVLEHDFSRPPELARQSMPGHSIESLWMAMDEAGRRGDAGLRALAAERLRRHLEAGWDAEFGGLAEGIHVGDPDYAWPAVHPVGTNLEFLIRGEYLWIKPLWALNEILIGLLMILEDDPGAEWASRYFSEAQRLIDEKYSQRPRGLPGYLLFADREFTPQPHVQRQDNYHPARQLMLNLLTLERMIQK